jgi:hypothetical protein
MSRERVSMRTENGASILASDGERHNWEVGGRMLRSWSWALRVTIPRFQREKRFRA